MEKLAEKWVWFQVFDIKLKTLMNFESNKNKIERLISKTFAWDLTEMIAYKTAYECLRKGCRD
jgi:hypothetical protein